ncbi:MAG: GNAT family N-acetyltransferase, partial [Cyanobacteria bacterium J06638_38]
YGRKLIDKAKLIARELGKKVMLIQGDPNAKNFYLKVGGQLIGERKSASISSRYLPLFKIDL